MRERSALLVRSAVATILLTLVSCAMLSGAARDHHRGVAAARAMLPAQNLADAHRAFDRFEMSAVLP
jgi:hypothetical protein